MFKPELLLPAGSIETFFAAIEGGADAVYLGLKKFNARNRAKNFSFTDLYNITQEAHSRNKKVYVTLNTLLKNEELSELIEVLNIISQCKVDALIIQDFAVLNLVVKYFKNLKIHASTQMAIHNSVGCNYFSDLGFERTILSRELTLNELKNLQTKTKIQTEIFVHGALCYSFSGHCMFSSYLGGNSANRGLCTQVCRRNFNVGEDKLNLFSLKDIQLIDFIPVFSDLKIASLKVEGRMKNAEYVYNTAKAYRMAIDNHQRIEEAKELLKFDFAREKTTWFMGGNLQNAITNQTGTGIFIGKINSVQENCIIIDSDITITASSKLRSRHSDDTDQSFIKIQSLKSEGNKYVIYCETSNLKTGDELYMTGSSKCNFSTKFKNYQQKNFNISGQKQNEQIINSFRIIPPKQTDPKFYIRISDLQMLDRLDFTKFEAVFLKLRSKDFDLLLSKDLSKIQIDKIHIELPKYISELKLEIFAKQFQILFQKNFQNFVISHLSQMALLPNNSNVSTNENVYLLNDIAINYVLSKQIINYCYPIENDYPNLLKGRDRNGIIPIYFYPELFYSRMPIKISKVVKDEAGKQYVPKKFNGFTTITDKNPVSFSHSFNKLCSKGFYKFLIDLSNEPDFKKIAKIMTAIKKSEKIYDSSDFNIKKGLH